MTPVGCCGAECGVSGSGGQHWSVGANASFDTSTVRSGARSIRLNPTAAAASAVAGLGFSGSGTLCVSRLYFRAASFPSIDAFVGGISTGSDRIGLVYKNSDGKFYAGRMAGTTVTFGSTGVTAATGQWYSIDVRANVIANPWVIDVALDGVALGPFSPAVAASTISAGIALGGNANATFDWNFDDFITSATSGDYPIGAGYVNHFIPTSDGTHNVAGAADFQRTLTGTDILNATTTAFQLIDDVPLESGASVDWQNMIAPPNATDYVECIFGPASGISVPTAGPRAVEVIAGYHQAGATVGNMEIRMNDNGTTNALYTATAVVGVTSVAYARKHYATAIAGGGAWTVSAGAGNFNNLRVRFGSPAAVDANPDQYFDCIMVEAEFAPVVVVPPTFPISFYRARRKKEIRRPS